MAQDYDKLLKEILREIFPAIATTLLGITAKRLETLPVDLQYTTELKTDQLWKVTPVTGLPFVLHVELQTRNDKTMPARMLAYCGLIHLLHGLPVYQYVLYTGKGRLSMPNTISFPTFAYQYHLLDMRQFAYAQFLSATQPQEVILAILGDFGSESPRLITRKILTTLKELSGNERELSRWVRQLSRLGSLRNLSNTIIQEALSMAITLDKTKDGLYQLGKEEGKEEVAISLLKEGFTPEVVSRVSKLPLEKVKTLQGRLTEKS